MNPTFTQKSVLGPTGAPEALEPLGGEHFGTIFKTHFGIDLFKTKPLPTQDVRLMATASAARVAKSAEIN